MPSSLFVPLASGPFYRFQAGSKTVEIRQARGRWHRGNVFHGRQVILRRGYSTKDELRGKVGHVATAPAFVDLPAWALRGADVDPDAVKRAGFYDPEAPVIAFEVVLDAADFDCACLQCENRVSVEGALCERCSRTHRTPAFKAAQAMDRAVSEVLRRG